MSVARLAQPSVSEVQRWTNLGTLLVAAFVFSLNARGSILVSQVTVQWFGLDRYKIQWVTGLEGIGGLTSLFAGIYLMKLLAARRTFLLGTACMAVGALGEALAQTPLQLCAMATLRSCAGFLAIPGLTIFQRLLPGRVRFAYCTWLTLIYGGQVVVEPVGALLAFNPSWRALYVGIGVCARRWSWWSCCLPVAPTTGPVNDRRNTPSTLPVRACSWLSSHSCCSCCTAATTWAGA